MGDWQDTIVWIQDKREKNRNMVIVFDQDRFIQSTNLWDRSASVALCLVRNICSKQAMKEYTPEQVYEHAASYGVDHFLITNVH